MILLSLHNPLTTAVATAAAAVLVLGLHDGELNFELGNGSVKLKNPIEIQQQQQQTEIVGGRRRRGGGNRGTILRLYDPQFLGSGGGGAVFSYSRRLDNADNKENSATTASTTTSPSSSGRVTQTRTKENDVVVKISWLRSAESVRNECKILQELERKMVTGVEICLASTEYQDDPRRVMIVMEPVIEDSVSSILEIPLSLRPKVVDALIRTMVQMLAANVVTTDVQPLISTRTGQVVLIDMTEAKIMTTPSPNLQFVDVALVSSFCTEIFNLIPENLLDVASKSLVSELQRQTIIMEEEGTGGAADAAGSGSHHSYLPNEVYTILQGQTMLSQTALDYLDKMVLYTTDTTTVSK